MCFIVIGDLANTLRKQSDEANDSIINQIQPKIFLWGYSKVCHTKNPKF